MPKILTCLNYQDNVDDETVLEPVDNYTETVPDQAMSLRTILDTYRRTGAIPSTGRAGYFDDDAEDAVPDGFNHLDLVEQSEFLKDRRDRLEAKLYKAKAKAAKRSEDAKAVDKPADASVSTTSDDSSTNTP